MTRIEFLKKYTARFLAALLLVGLIVYTIYHIQGASAAGLMTVPTREVTDLRMVSGTAYLFRDERLLSVDGGGVVDDLVQNGVKVGKNQELTRVYTDYHAMERESAQVELERINRAIAVLESSAVSGGTSLAEAEKYRAEAGALHLSLRESILDGRWGEISDASDEMMILLNRYGILTGKLQNAGQVLEELRDEKSALLKGEPVTVRNTDSSGFFYNRHSVDGYESVYTMQRLNDLTLESLDELKNQAPVIDKNSTTVGKMVYGYTWYFAVEMEGNAGLFAPGYSYEIHFSRDADHSLSMTCERTVEGSDGRFLAILSSNDLPAWFSYDRVQPVEVVVGSTVGYYIPDSALVTRDGVVGVYIFKDSTVYFRRIDVIYRGEGYCIAAQKGERGDDYLDLYDILITSGKNLYDGKVY